MDNTPTLSISIEGKKVIELIGENILIDTERKFLIGAKVLCEDALVSIKAFLKDETN